MAAKSPRLAVLISGNGSNLQAVIDATQNKLIEAQVALVVSNKPEAFGLQRAADAGIATHVIEAGYEEREVYDSKLSEVVANADVDLVVLAGWMRLLTNKFLSKHQVINVHPALPGTFAGIGAIKRTYEAWQNGDVTQGGVMVHYVPDEGIDDGPVICSEPVPLTAKDSLNSFEDRVHAVEHRLLVDAISNVLEG